MNISTLAKILGVSISELREVGNREGVTGFSGRNTRIPYQSALDITKVLRPDKVAKLKNDDRVYLPLSMTVSEFAESIDKAPGLVVKTLVMNGVMATINEKIDYDTASLIAAEIGIEVFPENPDIIDNSSSTAPLTTLTKTFELKDDKTGTVITRPPVVTVMGHVDHGKTTLLDTIRRSNVVAGEAGAITQHISSYQIEYNGKKITFVDTPGHEAFTAMRARGTQLADFIILMVSAVEGPKPQTIEVIERAKLSKTPVIVAINKIDLPNSDIERVRTDLAAFGLVPEEWGGETPFIPVSAKLNQNIDQLLDTILLFAEVANLKGKIDLPGQAVVIESFIDPRFGVVTNTLVIQGSLQVGDSIVCDSQAGKIKKLMNSLGVDIVKAELAEPIQFLGLPSVANVGELVVVHPTQKEAQRIADETKTKQQSQKRIINTSHTSITSDQSEINVVIVADVSGSLEALKESILKIPQDNAKIVIKRESVGAITETDVEFAEVSSSTILSFHTDILPQAQKALKNSTVQIVQSDIIYELLNWVEEEELKRVKHEVRLETLGKAEILKVFKSDKPSVQIVGAEVKDGKIFGNKMIRLVRDNVEVGRMEVVELRRNDDKTNEVNISQQFGISLTGKVKVQVGDIIQSVDEIIIK